jgi:geranylgeranyl reductase family protein
MNSNQFDVIIVGGGPAGGNAAYHLSKNNISVGFFEKSELPRHKVCAGGITRRAAQFYPANLRNISENECSQLELFIDSKFSKPFVSSAKTPLITMVMRNQFDYALIQLAQNHGAQVFDKTLVKNIIFKNDYVEITTDKGPFQSKYLILADGAAGRLAKLLNFPDNRCLVPAAEIELPVDKNIMARFQNKARFDFGTITKGYGWVFPKRAHLSIGMLSHNKKTLRKELYQYLNFLEIDPPKEGFLVKGHMIPMSVRKAPFIRNRVILVGDSAGFVDPITAEGISYALQSGFLAAQALLCSEMELKGVKEYYEKSINKEIVREIKIAQVLAKIVYGPPALRSFLFGIAGDHFCKALTKIINGEKTYFDYLIDLKSYRRFTSGFYKNLFLALKRG